MPILLFLLFFTSLFSDDNAEFSLTNLSKSPIPKVAGTVNAISGHWVDQHYHDERKDYSYEVLERDLSGMEI